MPRHETPKMQRRDFMRTLRLSTGTAPSLNANETVDQRGPESGRREVLSLLGTLALSLTVCPNRRAHGAIDPLEPGGKRPNILFIYTDDQAPWALGASGNPEAHTPNLDRLVREGAYLVNSFATTPVCSPARVGLLTSRYGTELGIRDFIPQKGHKLYNPDQIISLNPQTITFPEVFAEAGYTNGLIGKWHVGELDETHPTQMGYHEFFGFRGGGIAPKDPILEEDSIEKTFEGLTTTILTDRAIAFLKQHLSDPFLLCVHYRAPHKPWLPVDGPDWQPYEKLDPSIPNPDYPDLDVPKMKRWMREYLSSVTGVDRSVGRLLETLDDLRLSEDTVVIFTSDHGDNMGHNGIWHKGNGVWATHNVPPSTENIQGRYRPNLYDNSLRVPAMVRWPGVIQPGTVVPRTTTNLDWYPTLLAIAGLQSPPHKTVRGRNMIPILKGEDVEWDDDLYAEYSMENYCRTHMRMYRTHDWKLVRDFLNPERDELFDLRNDPAETTNLIDDPRAEIQHVVDRLHDRIVEAMRTLDDPVLDRL